MTHKGHTVGGILAATLTCALTGTPLLGMIAVGMTSWFSSLLPDIDHPRSFMGRRLWFVHWPFLMLVSNPVTWALFGETPQVRRPERGAWLWIYYVLFPFHWTWNGRKRVSRLFDHRNLSHTLLILGIFSVLCPFIFSELLFLFGPEVWESIGGTYEWTSLDGRLSARSEASLILSVAFVAGYASHILLDMMTESGVPLLLPWTRTRYHILPDILRVRVRWDGD